MSHKLGAIALVSTIGIALISGCAGSPQPKTNPQAVEFASEAEAIAAAERTYAGYIQATNNVDLRDADTAEPVYEWLTGEALADDREVFAAAQADQTSRSGSSVITLVEPTDEASLDSSFQIDACVNIEDVNILNSEGESLVADDRPKFQSVRVTLTPSESTSTGLAISALSGREDGPPCGKK